MQKLHPIFPINPLQKLKIYFHSMHHNVWLIFDVQKDTKRIHILSLLLPKIQKKEAYPKTRFPKRKGCEGGRSKRVSIDSRCNPSRYIHKAHWRAFIRASFRQTKNSLPPSPSPPSVFIAPLPPYSRARECVNFLPYIGVEY